MLRDITLGQYFPGNSVIHTLDPRIKLILSILFIACVFCASCFASFGLLAVVTVILVALSGISPVTVLKSLKPVLFIVVFTSLINIFWTEGELLLVSFWRIRIYYEGVRYAALMILRILLLVCGSFVILTYTTSPVALTDAIERLTSPLQKIGLPTHEFAMMMSIALRFIPTLIDETDKIMSAQKARGADFETGGLIKRAKALIPILIPLFISSFRRADELAAAMECRLYHGGEGRTRLKVLKLRPADFLALALFIALLCGVIFINSRFERLI